VACRKYASVSGDDGGAGTAGAPFRTAAKLVSSLAAGETGCLLAGIYVEDLSIRTGGASGAPITMTSGPGVRATLRGRLWIADSANDVVVSDLNLDGRNAAALPSPSVSGDRVTFRGNDVTNYHTSSCFTIGSSQGWGTAVDTLVEGNRIHDCGKLPTTNHEHGIYVESSRNAHIVGNWIYDNADRGVQFYPDAQNSLVERNVIDGNGEGVSFGGEYGMAANGNVVRDNVISNSTNRYNVESWWPAGNPVGTGNLVKDNCVWNAHYENFDLSSGGYSAIGNVVADPLYVDRAAKNFTLRAGSSCAGKVP